MAHFAQLDENNTVVQVVVVNNSEIEKTTEIVEEDGTLSIVITQSEASGVAFCKGLFGDNTNWIQTSYNNNFRGKYAGIGDTYNGNAFVSPIIVTVNDSNVVVDSNVISESNVILDSNVTVDSNEV